MLCSGLGWASSLDLEMKESQGTLHFGMRCLPPFEEALITRLLSENVCNSLVVTSPLAIWHHCCDCVAERLKSLESNLKV
jgi:hypothetical protein